MENCDWEYENCETKAWMLLDVEHSAGLIRLTETGYGQLRLGKQKSAITKKRVRLNTILTITFTACVRHASSERSENGSHWNQKLGGAQTLA